MGQDQVILIDTHIVVWLALNPKKLSRKACAAIDEARTNGEGLAVASISLFELAIIATSGRIHLDISVESFLQEVEARFIVKPLTGRISVKAQALPEHYPNDPMDRIIGATALIEGLSLITADERIRKAKVVSTIW
ncbi:MAG TPA: type II toxin-antitoxin system VapC family toxin [Acidobacteriaceae bacterium]|nr:type II toxin-antitoxin system VapC family toxin [Acidobacteriaceae bacterium]